MLRRWAQEHSDFAIGHAFATRHSLWRCIDTGIRTVVAIRLNRAEVATAKVGREKRRAFDPRREPGWFSAPPSAVAETAFDEDDSPAGHPVAEDEVMGWTAEGGQDRRR